jgi:hypothetical protein
MDSSSITSWGLTGSAGSSLNPPHDSVPPDSSHGSTSTGSSTSSPSFISNSTVAPLPPRSSMACSSCVPALTPSSAKEPLAPVKPSFSRFIVGAALAAQRLGSPV